MAKKESSPSADRDRAEEIERALKSLPVRERGVLELRYGLKGEGPWTCEEIGRHFHVTTQRIQMIDNQTHGKLRDASVSEEDLVAHWNSVFPERKWRPWFFRRGRSPSR
jgi:DNA-directed RNA polymerase sigma subunit (sigma70/sigma32)